MVVSGTVEEPTLGILDAAGHGVDLRECGLYPESLQAAFPVLAAFVAHAGIAPYDLASRSGELKNLLVTQSPDGELMVRFVLRSQEPVARIRKHLPALLDALPSLRVASVNLLPDHKAVLEGEREILLTRTETLRMRVNDIDLHLRPQSFFQTNTEVAAALYRHATAWVSDAGPSTVWDLYCGVGGFALHVADGDRDVVGIETSVEAVASARASAAERGASAPGAVRGRRRHDVRARPRGAGAGGRQPAAAGHRRAARGPPRGIVDDSTSSTPAAMPSRWRVTLRRCPP